MMPLQIMDGALRSLSVFCEFDFTPGKNICPEKVPRRLGKKCYQVMLPQAGSGHILTRSLSGRDISLR
jgi:hypothetical protein